MSAEELMTNAIDGDAMRMPRESKYARWRGGSRRGGGGLYGDGLGAFARLGQKFIIIRVTSDA